MPNQLEVAVNNAVTEMNRVKNMPPLKEPPGFVSLTEQVANALIEAAQHNLNIAQSKLDEVKQFAADLKNEMVRRSSELDDLRTRLEMFGDSVLNAHKQFQDGSEQK